VILSGRRVNDNMGMFVASKVVKLMIRKGQRIDGARALILGITFKENCPDIRNSRVIDIYHELEQFGIQAAVYDPLASGEEVYRTYGIRLLAGLEGRYDAIILAVAHREFLEIDFTAIRNGEAAVVFDTKSCLDRRWVDARL
jgi:UDP-N-acetyl-D-galactosamine dehydrogenase